MSNDPGKRPEGGVVSGSATEALRLDKSVDCFLSPTEKALRKRLPEMSLDELRDVREMFDQVLSTKGVEGPEVDIIRALLPKIEQQRARRGFELLMPRTDQPSETANSEPTWNDTPEDERPVFAEPEHPNQPKPYRAEIIDLVKAKYLANGNRIRPAIEGVKAKTGVKAGYSTVYGWVRDDYSDWR